MITFGLLDFFNLIDANILNNLRYERLSISSHEYWRLITAHLIHLNLIHTLMNSAALFILIFVFWGDIKGKFDVINFIACIIMIDVGLFFLQPELTNYVGFSGILHGLFAYYFIKTINKFKISSCFGIALLIAKLLWEQSPLADTSMTASYIGGNVATAAHLYGGITGLISGILCNSYTFLKKHSGDLSL
jgi:rhomboid family GlyGly-CTERM serine protease